MLFFITNPILIAAAIIPAVILMLMIYKADKLDKESPRLLFSLVLQGIVATFAALLTERLGSALLGTVMADGTALYNALLYFVVVACSEEGFKYLLLRRRTWRNPEFNCQFDGVVYAVFVSLGFALWENIGYAAMYGLENTLVRALTAVPGHACFGVFMGAWYGLAKRYDGLGDEVTSRRCRRLAFIMPALAHGCYDYIATMESVHYAWLFVGFILVMFVVAAVLVRRMSKHDRHIDRPPEDEWL